VPLARGLYRGAVHGCRGGVLMSRFQYLKGTSFFHRMDPTWKLIWSLVVVVTVIVNFDISYNVAWFAYAVILILVVARIPVSQYLRAILLFAGIALLMFVWDSVYYAEQAHVLFAWGPINVTQEGVLEGLGVFFRIITIVSLSMIFTLTTDPGRLVESLIQVGKVPYRLGYTAYAVLRFIPLYENEMQVMSNAHLIRGVGETGKGLLSKVRLYWSLLVPLLVSGIRRAQALSIAMDSRGFGAFDRRTILREVTVDRATVLFVLLHIAIAAAAFYFFVIAGYGSSHIG
jgi:energy-coupling factor transport system permease protein